MAGLTIKNLVKSFGRQRVIDNISFEVPDGEFCILLGPSGCGKSTILRLIAGLDQQDSGEILIGDREVSDLSPRERDVAMVFQSYALYPHMSVFENMAFSLKMRKTDRAETEAKVREAARLLHIEPLLGRKPRELSGGQRQRAAIGRAIVRDPLLFLFDEPLSNLDAKLRAAMRVELAGLHAKLGKTVLYVTHDQTEAMTLGQTVIVLDKGKIQQKGPPSEMYDMPSNLFVASFIGSPQINLVEGTVRKSGEGLHFISDMLRIDAGFAKSLESYDGREVTLGIRPESLIPGAGDIRATLHFVEQLGAEKILYVRCGSQNLTARVPADYSGQAGDEEVFSLKPKGIHFFLEGERINI